jgi:hypothetical protein
MKMPMFRLAQRFVAHVLPNVIRPLQALWNQMIGFVFLVLAAWALPSAIRNWKAYHGDGESLFRVVLSFGFAAMMMYFGISSFLRARRIHR